MSQRTTLACSLEVSSALYKQLNIVALQPVVSLATELVIKKVRMRDLKRKRVDAPRVPTLEDVHPYTTWSMCVRVYHKFYMERFAIGRKRLSMVLLDEKGKKMAAIIYDDHVERFERLLVEGRVYYVRRMSAEPVMRNQDYWFADSHFVCCFTSQTVVREIRTVKDDPIISTIYAS